MGPPAELRVLLVEDEQAFSSYVRAVFEGVRGAVVIGAAGTLESALQSLRAEPCDCVLLDLNLPDSSGLDTLRRVTDAAVHAAVVVLTGVADAEIAEDALRLGAQDWLVKGELDPEVLRRAVRYAVERKRLVDELLQSQKLEVAGRLATGIAHEFNNILTAIVGSAHLVQAATSEDERDAAASLLHRAARQGGVLSRQLLSLARNPSSNPAVVSATLLVENALPLVQAILPGTIKLSLGPLADVDVEIDPGQFDQVLLNLVLNARDAMPRGGVLRIAVEARSTQGPSSAGGDGRAYAVLEVEDSGSGIDADAVPHLFEPFYSTKGPRGTGLGLAVCAEIVERYGGRIHVESRVGRGTSMAVWLPEARTSADRA